MKNKFAKTILLSLICLLFSNIASAHYAGGEDEDLLNKKIGQMIIIGFEGDNIYSGGFKRVKKELENGDISGVIYFSKNIKSKEDVRIMNDVLKNSSSTIPFIGIDNEGGYIQRHTFDLSKSAAAVAKLPYDDAVEEYAKMSNLLSDLGFNFNFGPVVDLDLNNESIIHKKARSYGANPDVVTSYAKIFIKEHNRNNIVTSIKHFPGHGSIPVDTHVGFAESTLSATKEELEPYYNLKDFKKLNTVMISHIYNANYDNDFPASLSKKTVQDLLIEEIGFKGVVVSDDLDMRAIKDNYTLSETVRLAINAGVNLLIFSNNIKGSNPNIADKVRKIIINEIKQGRIDSCKIDESFDKIMELKRNILGIENQQN